MPWVRYKVRSSLVLLAFVLASGFAAADGSSVDKPAIRILSWNISKDAFVTDPSAFRAVILRADADVLLLDEVLPSADAGLLQKALAGSQTATEETWHIDFGKSGGRQRNVIVSRAPVEALPEFSSVVPYPEADRDTILQRMSDSDRSKMSWSLEGGIPVNGAIILTGGRRLLVVVADLQCCGDDPQSWEEFLRRVEVREIRQLIRRILERTPVDGIVLAGDYNLVSTSVPLVILAGPYRSPHLGLMPVELYHLNGSATWTWDGRGTRFPSRALDYQLYGPRALKVSAGFILDTEDLPAEELKQYGLQLNTSSQLSDHRPLVVEYTWR